MYVRIVIGVVMPSGNGTGTEGRTVTELSHLSISTAIAVVELEGTSFL